MNIITKLSLLLSHMVLPKEGHLYAAVNVMDFDCQMYNSRLVYDPSYPEIDTVSLRKVIGQSFVRISKRLYK